MSTAEAVAQIRARQVALYGEPLQAVLGRCAHSLHLTQAKMSELLGISAPMLSQLINGHRIKIGNPTAAQRLQWMIQIAQQVDEGEMTHAEAMQQLQQNAQATDIFNQPSPVSVRRTRHLAVDVQEMCRVLASAADFLEAADTIRPNHPEIAEFLSVFGAERTDRAIEYADRLRAQAPA